MMLGKGDETVGNPHRAQISKFELFEPILWLILDKQFPVEQFEATVAQSTVPSPPLTMPCLASEGGQLLVNIGQLHTHEARPRNRQPGPRAGKHKSWLCPCCLFKHTTRSQSRWPESGIHGKARGCCIPQPCQECVTPPPHFPTPPSLQAALPWPDGAQAASGQARAKGGAGAGARARARVSVRSRARANATMQGPGQGPVSGPGQAPMQGPGQGPGLGMGPSTRSPTTGPSARSSTPAPPTT